MDKNFQHQRSIASLIYLIILIIGIIFFFKYQNIFINALCKFLWLFICGWLGLTIRSFVLRSYKSSPWPAYFVKYPIFLLVLCSIMYFISTSSHLEGDDFYISLSVPCSFLGFYIYKTPEMMVKIFK